MKLKRWIAVLLAAVCVMGLGACKEDESQGVDPVPYSFVFDGVTITPGEKAKDVLAALSAHDPNVSAKGSCLDGADGEDVRYVYTGFYIETFRLSEGHEDEEIRWIVFTDDSVSTQRGIKIGSTLQEVKDEYGSGVETDSLITYLTAGVHIRFSLRDRVVVGISYTVAE